MPTLRQQLEGLTTEQAAARLEQLGLKRAKTKHAMVDTLEEHFRRRPREISVGATGAKVDASAVLAILEKLPWRRLTPTNNDMSRGWSNDSFILGRSLGVAGAGGFEKVVERAGRRYGVSDRVVKAHAADASKDDLERLWSLLKGLAPRDFKYTSVQCHRNGPADKPHNDAGNSRSQLAMALGSYTGGRLVVETDEPQRLSAYDIKERPTRIDLRRPHWTEPYRGTRYSVIWCSILEGEEPLRPNRP